jgi:hypothetical protein
MKTLVRRALIFGACSLTLLGCHKRRNSTAETSGNAISDEPRANPPTQPLEQRSSDFERGSGTMTTNAELGAVDYESATIRLVAARCDREVACNLIGAKERFANIDTCTARLTTSTRRDLKPTECPNGVDEKRLSACVTAIHDEECNNPLEILSRIAACRTSALCLKSGELPSR